MKSKLRKLTKKISLSNGLVNNIFWTFLIKGMAMFISLFSMPAYISYFNDQKILGVWFTLVAILNWILMFDFGVGNGLRNKLVEPLVKNDMKEVKEYISSAYIAIGFITIISLIVLLGFTMNVNWNSVLKVSNAEIGSIYLATAVTISVIGVLIQFWLKLVTSVLYALQKTALVNLLSLITSVSMFLYVYSNKSVDLEIGLVTIALAQLITINLPLLIANIWVFSKKYKEIRPSFKFLDKSKITEVVSIGGQFFLIQFGLLILNSTNEMLITWRYASENVVSYQVYYRLFFTIVTIYSLLTQPLWSAVTKAFVEGKIDWIKKAYRTFNNIALAGTFMTIIVTIFSPTLISIWLGKSSFNVEYFDAIFFSIYVIVTLFYNSSTCIANGIGALRTQMYATSIGAIFKVPMVLLVGVFVDRWSSIMIANCIIVIPMLFLQVLHTKRLLDKTN